MRRLLAVISDMFKSKTSNIFVILEFTVLNIYNLISGSLCFGVEPGHGNDSLGEEEGIHDRELHVGWLKFCSGERQIDADDNPLSNLIRNLSFYTVLICLTYATAV